MAKSKVCVECEVRKGLSAYRPNPNADDGVQRICRDCVAEKIRNNRNRGDAISKANKALSVANGDGAVRPIRSAIDQLARQYEMDVETVTIDRSRIVVKFTKTVEFDL